MSAPSDKNILLSSVEAAEIAGVTSGYITRVCREGKLKGVRRDASWFVERAELETYLVKVAAEKKARAEKLAQERVAEYRQAFQRRAFGRLQHFLDRWQCRLQHSFLLWVQCG